MTQPGVLRRGAGAGGRSRGVARGGLGQGAAGWGAGSFKGIILPHKSSFVDEPKVRFSHSLKLVLEGSFLLDQLSVLFFQRLQVIFLPLNSLLLLLPVPATLLGILRIIWISLALPAGLPDPLTKGGGDERPWLAG